MYVLEKGEMLFLVLVDVLLVDLIGIMLLKYLGVKFFFIDLVFFDLFLILIFFIVGLIVLIEIWVIGVVVWVSVKLEGLWGVRMICDWLVDWCWGRFDKGGRVVLDWEDEDEFVIGLFFSCFSEVGVEGESVGGCDEVEERG